MLRDSFCDGENEMTMLSIKAMLKSAAPYKDPKGIKTVLSESLVPATIAVTTSGAPLASAKKVIPAKASDISTSNIVPYLA